MRIFYEMNLPVDLALGSMIFVGFKHSSNSNFNGGVYSLNRFLRQGTDKDLYLIVFGGCS